MKKTLAFILFISINLSAQNGNTNTSFNKACEAYGYLVGQKYILNKIKEDFPNLQMSVTLVNLMFNASFGTADKNLKLFISKHLNNEEMKSFDNKLIQEYIKIIGNVIDSEDNAKAFIEDVKDRAAGNIDSPYLETLLYYQFSDNPENEFLKGFVKTFNSLDHPKAKGTNWQVKIPKSWSSSEADRPNIIQKFRSENGTGNESIMLLIKNFPNDQKISKSEIEELFTEKESKSMIPNSATFLIFKKMTFDGIKGCMLEYEQIGDRLDLKFKVRTQQYVFILNNQMYFLQCNVNSNKTQTNLSSEMEKFNPLFKLVANSIVVSGQY